MRVVIISDTHCVRPQQIPEGEILVCAGDLTHLGNFAEFKQEVAWLKSLPHKHKIFVPGNHDCCCFNLLQQNLENKLRGFLHPVVFLRDSGAVVERLRVWGTPWVSENSGGDFNLPSAELLQRFQGIPKDTELLITHTPPHGTLDVQDGEHIGSPELTQVLRGLPELKLHVFGHCHAASGITESNGVVFCNAAVRLTGKPFVVDVDSSGKFRILDASDPHSSKALASYARAAASGVENIPR